MSQQEQQGKKNKRNWKKVLFYIAAVIGSLSLLLLAFTLTSGRGTASEAQRVEVPVVETHETVTEEVRIAEKEALAGMPTPEPGLSVVEAKEIVTEVVSGTLSLVNPSCRSLLWMREALNDTNDVASLISVLDRDFSLSDGGQWSEPGYRVPGQSVLWTDLFQNVSSLPTGVYSVRVQGGWGVYYTTQGHSIPSPNGGGRWMRLCESLLTRPMKTEIPIASTTCEIPETAGMSATAAIETMNDWFENTGYQWGDSFSEGNTLPAGSYFWTDLGESYTLPDHIKAIAAEGNWGVFVTTQEFVPLSSGRYVNCK